MDPDQTIVAVTSAPTTPTTTPVTSTSTTCPPGTEGTTASTVHRPCGVVDRTATTTVGSGTGTGTYDFALTQPIPQANGTQYQTASLELDLVATAGTVTGTIEGTTDQLLTQPACPSGTVTPGQTTAEVEGTIDDDVLSLTVVNVSWQRPVVEPCPEGGMPGLIGETIPSGIFGFEESLLELARDDQGVYRYDHIETIPVGLAPFTVEYHVAVQFG
jgi:hypothetical protein